MDQDLSAAAEAPAAEPYPVFCTVVFIMDLLLCLMRVVLAILSAIGTVAIIDRSNDTMMIGLAIGETLTGGCLGCLGPVADGLMLFKKRIGFYIGLVLVLTVLISIGVGFAQFFVFPNLSRTGAAGGVGAVIGAFVRIGMLLAYIVALFMFSKWQSRQARS